MCTYRISSSGYGSDGARQHADSCKQFFVAAVLLTIVLTKIVNIVSSYIISLVITTVVIVLSLLLSAYNICFLVFCVFNVSFWDCQNGMYNMPETVVNAHQETRCNNTQQQPVNGPLSGSSHGSRRNIDPIYTIFITLRFLTSTPGLPVYLTALILGRTRGHTAEWKMKNPRARTYTSFVILDLMRPLLNHWYWSPLTHVSL